MVRQLRSCCLLLAVLILAGCGGGSGSSGFDAVLAEEQAIARALETNRCIRVEGATTLVCPLSGTAGSPDLLVRPVTLGSGEPRFTCGAKATSCGLFLTLEVAQPAGIEAVVIAIRRHSAANSWHIVGPSITVSDNPILDLTLDVPVQDLEGIAAGDFVQVAVLVFPQLPELLPSRVERLSATGAQFVLITPPVRVGGGVSGPPA